MNRSRPLILLVSISALGAATFALLLTSAKPRSSQAQPINSIALAAASNLSQTPVQSVVTPQQLKRTLIRLDLDPSALAAASVSVNSVASVVSAVEGQLEIAPAALPTIDAAYAEAAHRADVLERKVQSGVGTAEDVTALNQAQNDLATATSQRHNLLQTIFDAGVVNLGNPQRNRLQAVRNNAAWELPIEYRVISRTEPQWVTLRDALAHERYAVAHNVEVDPEVQQYLAEVRANLDVSSAITSLGTSAVAVTNAWNQALE